MTTTIDEAAELRAILAEQEAAKRREWEATTVGMKDEQTGQTWTIAELRSAFDRHHPGPDWKRRVDVLFAGSIAELTAFCKAIEFFQGCRPRIDPWRPELGDAMIRVTSRGYVC